LRLDFSPAIRNDGFADILAFQGENETKTTRAITRMGNAKCNLCSNETGAKEFTALEVPWLRVEEEMNKKSSSEAAKKKRKKKRERTQEISRRF
jgi:ribonuclease PH